jgi:hypothetical protein
VELEKIMKSAFALIFLLFGIHFSQAKTHSRVVAETRIAYQEIDFGNNTPDYEAFAAAMQGYQKLMLQGKIKNQKLSIIDFNISANKERFWVLDMKNKKVLYHTLVAHGRNSGEEYAKTFSNTEGSYQSSLGFYLSSYTYDGKRGNSLKLLGIEKNINDAAFNRGIVIHGASYVSEEFIKNNGRLGRSLGCPAVPEEICSNLISAIQNGSCVFIYKKDPTYFSASSLIDFI